jgi:hypothetical protein
MRYPRVLRGMVSRAYTLATNRSLNMKNIAIIALFLARTLAACTPEFIPDRDAGPNGYLYTPCANAYIESYA